MTKSKKISWILLALALILFETPCFAQSSSEQEWEALGAQIQELFKKGKYSEALEVAKSQVALSEERFGGRNPRTATALTNLAGAYNTLGQYGEAEPLFQQALEIWKGLVGPDHPNVAMTSNSLAVVYQAQGRYAEAEPLFQQALEIWEAALGPDHPNVATTRSNLAIVYRAQGRYAEAKPLFQQALASYEHSLGPEHPLTANTLAHLGGLYLVMVQFSEAEPYFQRALAIQEKVLGPEHPNTADTLVGLGNLYRILGQFAEAEPLLQRGLKINEKVLGPDHPSTAASLNALAVLYVDMEQYSEEQYDETEGLLKRALFIQEQVLGPMHSLTAQTLNNLAFHYKLVGDYAKAEPLYRRAVTINEQVLGAQHPETLMYLNNLGDLYLAMREFGKAEPLLHKALAMSEQALGADHPRTVFPRRNMALWHASQHRYQDSLKFFERATTLEGQVIENVLAIPSERQQLSFIKQITKRNSYFTCLSLIHQFFAQDPAALRVAINLVLARKGIVLDVQAQHHQSLAQSLDPQARERWETWRATRASLAKLLLNRPPLQKQHDYQRQVEAARVQIKKMEASLPREARALRHATVEQVAPTLPPNGALVEFVKFRDFDWKNIRLAPTWRYLALLLTSDQRMAIVDLGDAANLEDSVQAALADLRREPWLKTGDRQVAAAERLYHLLWKPISKAIGDINVVVLSPDGILNLVPFVALRSPAGRFLVEDLTLMIATSGRDLLKGTEDFPPQTDLFLAADPSFDWMPPYIQAQSSDPALKNSESKTHGKKFLRIEGTASALTIIPPLISGDRKIIVDGEDATEQVVVGANRPRVLHLATHGFFSEDQLDLTPKKISVGGVPTTGVSPGYENPLARSGLALAGANHAMRTIERRDGILTALEVSGMVFHGTDLVVLSACDTGTGEVRTGEGVYGLRRAFVLAGARNLVMSLWPVWDKEAPKQMKSFYTYYGQGVPPAQALRKAQLERITWMRKHLGAAPPSLWAPFIVQVSGSLENTSKMVH